MKLLYISVLLIVIYFTYYNDNIEKWQNYKIPPYNYVKTGYDPLYFYRYDRYRKPYRYPFTFYQSYPYNHMTSFD